MQVILDPGLWLHLVVVLVGISRGWLEPLGWHRLPNPVVEAFYATKLAIEGVLRIIALETGAGSSPTPSLVDL